MLGFNMHGSASSQYHRFSQGTHHVYEAACTHKHAGCLKVQGLVKASQHDALAQTHTPFHLNPVSSITLHHERLTMCRVQLRTSHHVGQCEHCIVGDVAGAQVRVRPHRTHRGHADI